MKQTLIFICFLTSILSHAQPQSLRAYMDNKQFNAPGVGNYIELYFQFVGSTIRYQGRENGLQGEISIEVQITANEKVINSDAYRLLSPIMKDSIVEDFYEVKRIALPPGHYQLHVKLQDLGAENPPISAKQNLDVLDFTDSICVSNIEIFEYAIQDPNPSNFTKSGYKIIPRLSTFYPEALSSIPVYFELYNTHLLSDSIFGLKQSFLHAKSGNELEQFTTFSRHNAAEVIPILRNVDIAKLQTGTYFLKYTLLDRNLSELSTQTYFFERNNDMEVEVDAANFVLDPAFQASITPDSVGFFLESLIPIAKQGEIKNIIQLTKSKDAEKQRRYIQAFWIMTAPNEAYEKWLNYKGQVQLVEKLYANNFQEGFETDRGRVYLQYGAPTNIIIKETYPSEYPYEIWQYNKIAQFSNRRFIFYNPDLVRNSERLLHSDMLGELKNPGWPQALSRRNTNKGNIDDPNHHNTKHFGGNSNDLFRQY
jgi:GWxTD domain-containing protein